MTCPYCCVRAVGHPALVWVRSQQPRLQEALVSPDVHTCMLCGFRDTQAQKGKVHVLLQIGLS